ncbi:hypothetical protein [Kitasatospora sp. NBC_01266]|uniref:hypothetical protein n=1 Tax=Kitasatospora sp. NBC_01266 TaxID=2903572 RepID=UPI002E3628AB|nr:hypothetical protein [Kitasatospora sp. NBC_01266]
MTSHINRHTAEARRQAASALEDVTAILALANVLLPSVAVDWHSGQLTGTYLVDLGAARPDVVMALVAVLRAGVEHMAHCGHEAVES